jgi:hypothetical protein
MVRPSAISRRDFLKRTSVAAGIGALVAPPSAAAVQPGVALVIDPLDPLATSAPVGWAAEELRQALAARQIAAETVSSLDQARAAATRIRIAGSASAAARDLLRRADTAVAAAAESLALVPSADSDGAILLAAGSDARGLSYAVTELADRVRHGADPLAALRVERAIIEQPANSVRSIARCFESDVEDKGWFHDRAMWREYLSMLATHRFNRFSMTFGLQYNYPMEVSDVYLYFAYPFLLAVPGYGVAVRELPAEERDRNLETLQFIGQETVRRGLEFQVGLWTHGYKLDSPKVNYHVEGITAQNHAVYCRDALALLLRACPEISGITFRIHGESGIAEGDFAFWRTVFAGITSAGRRVEIDMHAKGLDQQTIDLALETGMPVKISPKYLGEHIGLPYHQSAVRELERPPRLALSEHFALSNGLRRFTRYSYGDFLKEDRRHGVLFRIWPGTQRALLWGDPSFAAGYGRHAGFCGSQGVELCEPLAFKGRMGSGRPGGRTAYADLTLAPRYDWQKFAYTYRIWGRLTYDPDAAPQTWRRQLATDFGPGAAACEAALAKASRILPLVTLAHGPSASNNAYWPEMYTNMSIVRDDPPRPYYDAGKPPRFGTVETFDPQIFSRIDEYAQELLSGAPGARYSPIEVAQWLDDLAAGAAQELAQELAHELGASAATAARVAFRRLSADVAIQCGIGRFFAAKFRSAVLWSLYERSGDRDAASAALVAYRAARRAWAEAADAAAVYVADVSYGEEPWLRGHWRDRLPAIDADIAEMARQADAAGISPRGDEAKIRAAMRQVLARPQRPIARGEHQPAERFQPGAPLEVTIRLPGEGTTALLRYRHVNQAEAWQVTQMRRQGDRHAAVIGGDYTGSPYPLQYYFELRGDDGPSLFPGLAPDLANQPYFVIRQA